jgi:hypothetical protein
MVFLLMMVIKYTKLYDHRVYGLVSPVDKVFVRSRATTLTPDPENQKGSSSHDGDQVYQVV